MPNNLEEINPDKVVIDNEIDPAKVVIDNDRTGFVMVEADRKRIREAFAGDPLGFIADTDVRSYISSVTEQFPDRDEYRKRMALAAYFTAFSKKGNFKFNLSNLDGIIEEFYKKKMSVDAAYADISRMIAPQKKWLGEKSAPAQDTFSAHGAAVLSGATDLSANLAATYLKFLNWGIDSTTNALSPLLPDSAVKFLKGYSHLWEIVGRQSYKAGEEFSGDLSRISGANPDFLLNMVQGDFDKVSVSDFTKALVQSAPRMGLQILVASIAPYALPAFVGAEQVAMKDYEVNEKQPDWSGAKKWTYIGLSAANEALFEMVTSKIVSGKLTKEAGAKILQRGMMKFLGLSAAKEGGSEAAQQLLSNANDLLFDIEDDYGKLSRQELFKRILSGVLESGFVGAVYGLPEGIAGFRNSREFAGVYSEVRNKHEKRVEELSAKENLTESEKNQLEVSKTILDSADPKDVVAIDYLARKNEEIAGDEEIRNGFDYAEVARTAADSAEDGDIISAVKAERRTGLRNAASWDYDDVVDRVQEYSAGFRDTVFHVVDNWETLRNDPDLDLRERAAYNINTGEIYINAGKVAPHEVFEVMLHEVVGHKGLRQIFKNDREMASMLDQVYQEHFQDEEFKEVARLYFEQQEFTGEDGETYFDVLLETPEEQQIAAEEYIAHIAEKEVKPSWWKEFIQKIRMAFARLPFFKDVTMTNQQIEILLARSSRKMRRGKYGKESRVVTDGNGLERTETEELRFLAEPFAEDQKRKIMSMTPKSGSEVVRKILYGGSITRNGNTVFFDGKNSHALKLHLDAPGFTPQRGPVTLEEIEKYLPLALAQVPKTETKKNKRRRETVNKIYLFTENGIIYTLITSQRGEFRSFYSNKKIDRTNRSAARGREHALDVRRDSNISQLSENASGTDGNGLERTETDGMRFSIAEYSREDQRDIVDILKPFVGTSVDMEPDQYSAYLKEHGVEISADDAFRFAVEAARQKNNAARKAAAARRDNWLYENVPEYKWAVDFAGSFDFKIKKSPRFEGIETAGTFWSGKKDKAGNVISLEELARRVSREIGKDESDVEQDLFDFFKDLTKPELRKIYTEFRQNEIAADRAQARAAFDEFMQQEKFRIEDAAVEILTAGNPVSEDWIWENKKVYAELYRRLFNGKVAPFKPSKKDIEAINAAIIQEGANAATYAQAYKDARQKSYEQYLDQMRQLREKVLRQKADALSLQREAAAFAEKNLPKEFRGEFTRQIISLLDIPNTPNAKYPEGKRKAAFDKLQKMILDRAAEVRKKDYLDKITKRLEQLAERVDSSRKVKGLRDIETQQKINRIIEITRMEPAAINEAMAADQEQMEQLVSVGESSAELEYDVALLNTYGELWNKSADEVMTAYNELQLLAKTGKDNLLRQINQRMESDERDRNELWNAIDGMKAYSAVDRKIIQDKRDQQSSKVKTFWVNFWGTLSLDGMLEAVAFFSEKDNVVQKFRTMAHNAVLQKNTINKQNADDCRSYLKKLLGTDSSFKIAETIGEWRNIKKNTNVFRLDPDTTAKQFEFRKISLEDARKILAKFDAGDESIPDYEAEAIRQQIATIDRKVKYDVPEDLRDGSTEKLIKLVEQEQKQQKQPLVFIPQPTFIGEKRELPLSQMQALYLKLMWDQKDVRYKMRYNGYSDSTMQQIDKFLLPEVKQFGNWMRDQLEGDRTEISKVYKELYFANFPAEEMYFPSVYNVTSNKVNAKSVDLNSPGAAAGGVAYSPGALKIRVYHLKEVKAADALTVFQNHRLLMNHFVTHASAARKLRSVLLNSNIQMAIEAAHGKNAYEEIKLALQDFINGGNADVAVNDVGSRIYSNAVRAKMAFNLVSGIKQVLGGITYLQEIPASALGKGITYAFSHPKEVWNTLGTTDYFKSRWNSGANADLKILLDSSGKDASATAEVFSRIDQFGSIALRSGDAFSTLFGGFAVYKYHYDNLIKQGVPQAEAKKEAIKQWEMATERTQQSSSPFMLNRYQRSGYMARTFTTFMSNQILLWNHNAPAIYKAIKYKDPDAVRDTARGIAALILSSAAMTAFDEIKEHWNDGEYQWLNVFWNSLADMVCGFGPAGSIASAAIQEARPGGFSRSGLWNEIGSGSKAVIRQVTDEDAKLSDRDYADFIRIMQLAGYFLPGVSHTAAIAREIRKFVRIIKE